MVNPARQLQKPLVYSCSGCSAAAQTANSLAVRLDRRGLADMSCIAGIGGGVQAILRIAHSGRQIVVIDGCPLHCAKACLAREGLNANIHLDLSDYGVYKRMHGDVDEAQVESLWCHVLIPLISLMPADNAHH